MSDDTEGRRPQDQDTNRQQQQSQQQNQQRGPGREGQDLGGGLRHDGGASQDSAGQGGGQDDALGQADHNIRGGGATTRPTQP